ncbi:unnamed protein product [Meganyctiphanes norvegica]|uniref:histone acetyltransferase n=1 Tax=Meganyctiphanes norvegica TaxID=48144 RepID=A0AAV2QK49_MEGNR
MSGQHPFKNPMNPERKRMLQEDLVLLLHAFNCQQYEYPKGQPRVKRCNLPHCQTLSNVLTHMRTCLSGRLCPYPLCVTSREIMFHYKNCGNLECAVCEVWLSRETDQNMPPRRIPDQNNQSPLVIDRWNMICL